VGGDWKAILAAGLQAFSAFLEYLRVRRDTVFRKRTATDGSGVLLNQLNPGHSDAPGADQHATAGTERNAGRVDG